MRAIVGIVVIIIVITIMTVDCKKQRSRSSRMKPRKLIVKCCGKKRCSVVGPRTRTTTSNKTNANFASSSQNSLVKIITSASKSPKTSPKEIPAKTLATSDDTPLGEGSVKGAISFPETTASSHFEATKLASTDALTQQTDTQPTSATSTSVMPTALKTSGLTSSTLNSNNWSSVTLVSSQGTKTSESLNFFTGAVSLSTTGIITSTLSTTTTTTTTASPKTRCPSSSCETYEAAMLANAPFMLNATGVYLQISNYFVFKSKKMMLTMSEAAQMCKSLNMTLCYIENLQSLPSYAILLETTSAALSLWTSGSNEGDFCDAECSFAWCSSSGRKIVNDSGLNVSALKIPSAATQRCLALYLNKTTSTLANADCAERKDIVCQPQCAIGSCPNLACSRDQTLFLNGSVQTPKNHGFWADICGNTYLFGNKIVNWTQNVEKCCSLGMEPLLFRSAIEQQCLSNYSMVNWPGNLNYWTGGVRACKGQWGWCAGAEFVPFAANLSWGLNQPEMDKDNETCLHLQISRNAKGVTLNDRKCSDRYIFACQLTTTAAPNVLKCPKQCSKNPALFTPTGVLNESFSYGNWYTTCGADLFFPTVAKTWQDAWEYCCSFGMKLLSVATSTRHICLSRLASRFNETSGYALWTSANGKGGGGFEWCGNSKNFQVKKMNWLGGHPNMAIGDCVSLKLSAEGSSSTFSSENCLDERRFVCEASRGNVEAKDVQNECRSMYNVSDSEMTVFTSASYNASAISTKLKCFLKCIGDTTGLLVMGNLVLPVSALLLIEEASDTPEKLQSNFQVVDECTGNKFQDECEAAAGIYQCVKEKAPAVTSAIEYELTHGTQTSIQNSPYPCVPIDHRYCRMKKLPCIVDEVLQQTLNSTGATSQGALHTMSNGRVLFVSKTNPAIQFSQARTFCCKMGMKLAEFYTLAEMEEISTIAGVTSAVNGLISEVFVNGRNQEVWCETNTVMSDEVRSAYGAPTAQLACVRASCLFYKPPNKLWFPAAGNYIYCDNTLAYKMSNGVIFCQ